MGARALEVTLDTVEWQRVLSTLRSRIPISADVVLGVGTVMDDSVCDIATAKQLGARFFLSPINPLGFIETCLRLDVVPVPSAFTTNEWYVR
jgi:2-keto-3-deoxy-6-phosphogluconate aldolase